jgi:hypothetical protein
MRDISLPDYTPDSEAAFYQAMSNEADALGTVIRGFIYLENQIIRFIEESVRQRDGLEGFQLGYAGRIHLAIALGLHPRFKAPLKVLGKIRNKFAHELTAELSAADADSLFGALNEVDRQIVQEVFRRLSANPQFHQRPPDFQKLDPLDRFRLILVSLRAAIISARLHVARHGV